MYTEPGVLKEVWRMLTWREGDNWPPLEIGATLESSMDAATITLTPGENLTPKVQEIATRNGRPSTHATPKAAANTQRYKA